MRISLLTAKNGELQSIGKLDKKTFKDFAELELFIGSKIEVEQTEEESIDEIGNIDGYPVKHLGAVEVKHESLPAYRRSTTSNTLYSAGYYGVKFPNGWVTSYCPKMSTLNENEFLGPFKTKLEMQNSISQKKKAIDI